MTKKVGISEFKEHCLKLIESFSRSGQNLIITKRDKDIALITPINSESPVHNFFGLLKGKALIKGDIVNSIDEKWHAESN